MLHVIRYINYPTEQILLFTLIQHRCQAVFITELKYGMIPLRTESFSVSPEACC